MEKCRNTREVIVHGEIKYNGSMSLEDIQSRFKEFVDEEETVDRLQSARKEADEMDLAISEEYAHGLEQLYFESKKNGN